MVLLAFASTLDGLRYQYGGHQNLKLKKDRMDFKEWSATAVSVMTLQVQRDIVRDCYVFPNGIECHEDYISPHNIFKKPRSFVLVSYMVPMSTTVPGAEISDDYYTPDGFGVPVFSGVDCMEKAFKYAMSLKLAGAMV